MAFLNSLCDVGGGAIKDHFPTFCGNGFFSFHRISSNFHHRKQTFRSIKSKNRYFHFISFIAPDSAHIFGTTEPTEIVYPSKLEFFKKGIPKNTWPFLPFRKM